eukprot:3932783-Rhodomonas_salina.1
MEVTDTGAQYQTPPLLNRTAASPAPRRIEPASTLARSEPIIAPNGAPASSGLHVQRRLEPGHEPERLAPGRWEANRLEPLWQRIEMSKRPSPVLNPPVLGASTLRRFASRAEEEKDYEEEEAEARWLDWLTAGSWTGRVKQQSIE